MSGAALRGESEPLLVSGTSNPSYLSNIGTIYRFDSSSERYNIARGKPHCCAVCCSVFSSVAVIFLASLGAYAAAGWNYIEGTDWSSKDRSIVARNAFLAAFLYLLTLCLSLFCWVRTARNSLSHRASIMFDNGYERFRDLSE
mmetsp:Transcript_1459/g.1711  ORF Transcript_1459/g.1711 Transcript_1459/m.1711 type:complete len:143 (-) Transcript_1459:1065-1493(-)